jgi:hypothetical protein
MSGRPLELEFAADRFLNPEAVLAIIVGEIVNRLACLEAVRDDSGRDARSRQDGPAKADTWIDRHELRKIRAAPAGERVQPAHQSVGVPVDALEVQVEQVVHTQLAESRSVDQFLRTAAPHEQVPAVRPQSPFDERMRGLEVLPNEVDSLPNLAEAKSILGSQRAQNEQFGQVCERQVPPAWIREDNQG